MAKNKQETISKTLMYLGPNLKGGVLLNGSVFRNGIPDFIKKIIEDNPLLEEMFVDVDRVSEFKHALETLGSEENRIFRNILGMQGEVKNVV